MASAKAPWDALFNVLFANRRRTGFPSPAFDIGGDQMREPTSVSFLAGEGCGGPGP